MPSIAIIDRIEPISREWDALVDRLAGSPFQRPGWIEAWWRTFGTGTLHTLTAWQRSTLVGVLPVYSRGRVTSSTTNFHSPEFGVLAEDEATTHALLRVLFSRGARRISIDYLDAKLTHLETWRRAADAAGYRLLVRVLARQPYVVVAGDWRGYEAGLAKGFRSDLRRCRRRLSELGELSVLACDGTDGFEGFMDDLLPIEASGWKGQRGTAIASRLETEGFYREVAGWAAGRGCLRLFSLRLDGRAVAVLYGIEEGGVLYALKAGYERALRQFSPGKLLLHAVVEHAFAAKLRRVELLGADEPYKRKWTNASRERLGLQAFAPSPRALLEWLAFAHGRPLARRLQLQRLVARRAASGGLTGK